MPEKFKLNFWIIGNWDISSKTESSSLDLSLTSCIIPFDFDLEWCIFCAWMKTDADFRWLLENRDLNGVSTEPWFQRVMRAIMRIYHWKWSRLTGFLEFLRWCFQAHRWISLRSMFLRRAWIVEKRLIGNCLQYFELCYVRCWMFRSDPAARLKETFVVLQCKLVSSCSCLFFV